MRWKLSLLLACVAAKAAFLPSAIADGHHASRSPRASSDQDATTQGIPHVLEQTLDALESQGAGSELLSEFIGGGDLRGNSDDASSDARALTQSLLIGVFVLMALAGLIMARANLSARASLRVQLWSRLSYLDRENARTHNGLVLVTA